MASSVLLDRVSAIVVRDLTLRMAPGESVALIGRSGAGKTTVLRLLNGLCAPSSGVVSIDAVPLTGDLVTRRRRIGTILQAPALFPHRTVFDNIATVPRLLGWDDARIRDAARAMLDRLEMPFERFASRMPRSLSGVAQQRVGTARVVLRVIDVVQTIPSLALFGFLIPLPLIGGIGVRTAIVALILYSLLPIVRNTVTGIAGIDPLIREAAIVLGMTDNQRLFRVELPLAMPSIFGGLRIATVIAIGVATIGAAVGGGGLGTLIFRGVAMVDTTRILAGALPAAALALVADLLFAWLERLASS